MLWLQTSCGCKQVLEVDGRFQGIKGETQKHQHEIANKVGKINLVVAMMHVEMTEC